MRPKTQSSQSRGHCHRTAGRPSRARHKRITIFLAMALMVNLILLARISECSKAHQVIIMMNSPGNNLPAFRINRVLLLRRRLINRLKQDKLTRRGQRTPKAAPSKIFSNLTIRKPITKPWTAAGSKAIPHSLHCIQARAITRAGSRINWKWGCLPNRTIKTRPAWKMSEAQMDQRVYNIKNARLLTGKPTGKTKSVKRQTSPASVLPTIINGLAIKRGAALVTHCVEEQMILLLTAMDTSKCQMRMMNKWRAVMNVLSIRTSIKLKARKKSN